MAQHEWPKRVANDLQPHTNPSPYKQHPKEPNEVIVQTSIYLISEGHAG